MVVGIDRIDQVEEVAEGGAEVALANMGPNAYESIGRRTFYFVRRAMQDPSLRERIKERAAQIREKEAREAACAGT